MSKEKLDIYKKSKVTCACGAEFETMSTKEQINIDVCSNCHPFYTGKQTRASKEGPVQKFNAKYGFKDNSKSE